MLYKLHITNIQNYNVHRVTISIYVRSNVVCMIERMHLASSFSLMCTCMCECMKSSLIGIAKAVNFFAHGKISFTIYSHLVYLRKAEKRNKVMEKISSAQMCV